ncbi:MAG: DUF1800 family protein [Terriglobales bacterium]
MHTREIVVGCLAGLLLSGCAGTPLLNRTPPLKASTSTADAEESLAPPEEAVANPGAGAAGPGATTLALARPGRSPRHPSRDATIARFLEQTTFGPTAADTAYLHNLATDLGSIDLALAKFIDDQMNPALTPLSVWPDPEPLPRDVNGTFLCGPSVNCIQVLWFQNALQGRDQLRQRTAFALSQMWVISGNTILYSDALLAYYEVLNQRAFGNYFQIIDEITRNQAMGFYLNMGNSPKAAAGSIANENYARELLQLFTIGLYLLNEDGTYKLDGEGQRIPAYREGDVREFARALTGWTYRRKDGIILWNQEFGSNFADARGGLVASETHHDAGSKTLFNYPGAPSSTLPAGQSAEADLNGALLNIFHHPNVPPFVSQQLIQRLVTSNPSPAYVGRVAAVFRDNGSGVRGDLRALVKAILLDPEARRGDLSALADDGHLKEPVRYITGILRTLGFSTAGQRFYTNSKGVIMADTGQGLWQWGRDMGQNVLFAPSVFSYFTPDHPILGGSLLGPEYQLQTTTNATIRVNFADRVMSNGFQQFGLDVNGSFAALAGLAADPPALADHLGTTFLRGQMSGSLRATLIDTVSALPAETLAQRTFRAKMGVYLVVTSSQYQVMR